VPYSPVNGLAFADGVSEDINTTEDLDKVRFTKERPIVALKIKEEKRAQPILRSCDKRGKVSATKIWTSDALAKCMTELGWRAGYKGRLQPYSFQRGHGNGLDRELTMLLYYKC
jgi:hypothetical protein